MEERGFNEVELRAILNDATSYRESAAPGRFVVATTHAGVRWEVVVEPDKTEKSLIVVTAYAVES